MTAGPDATTKPRQSRRILLEDWVARFLILDLAILVGSGIAPTWLGHWLDPELFATPVVQGQLEAITAAVVIFAIIARLGRLYRAKSVLELKHGVIRASVALFMAFALIIMAVAATKTTEVYSRLWFFSWMATAFVLILSYRAVVLLWLQASLKRGRYVHKALSVGVGCAPLPEEAIVPVGVATTKILAPIYATDPSGLAQLPNYIAQHRLDRVYIRVPWDKAPSILESMTQLHALAADVFLVPELPETASKIIRAAKLGHRVSLQVLDRPIDGWNYWLKRAQDLTIASLSLVVLCPFLLLAAMAIKLESRGPVIFRQHRMGFNGQIFEIWKFRTMYAHQADADAEQQTSRGDPRVTGVGRFLRRTSIDELPQLLNVIQGRMSIVGPRPHALKTRADGVLLAEAIDEYASRHRVKPGITGWAQIHGFRGELSSVDQLKRRVEYDLEYIDKCSIWLDLRIIVITLLLVFRDSQAY